MSFLGSLATGTPDQVNVNPSETPITSTNYQPIQQQGLGAFATGLQNAYGVQGQQGNLAALLNKQINNGGPNVALQQLKNATTANEQQAAGQTASIKGINPGGVARTIGENVAATNQGAAGEAAQEQLEQQLGAESQLGSVLNSEQNVGLSAAQLGGGLFGAATSGQSAQNATNVQNTLGANQINQQVAATNTGFQSQAIGAITSAISGGAAAASAGRPSSPAVESNPVPMTVQGSNPATSSLGFSSFAHGGILDLFRGGETPVRVSPGENEIPPEVARQGPEAVREFVASRAGKVPGRAKMAGDHPANDTVLTAAKGGTVIVPRSIADKPEKAASFVAALEAAHEDSGPVDNGTLIAHVRDLKSKIAAIETQLKSRKAA